MSIAASRWRRQLAICATGLVFGLPGSAAAGEPARFGMAQALEQAWRLHPQAVALDEREAEARATQDIAAGLTPEPGSLSIGSRNDRFNRNLGRQEYEIELAAPLWLPGQQAARADEAASRSDEALARRAVLRAELAGELREAWWALAAARNGHALAARRLDTARQLAADVGRRYQVGELSRIDANLAQTEVHAAGAELIETEATLLQAEQALRMLTGTVPPPDMADEAPATRAADGTPAAAETHPLLTAAAAAARSARARLKVAGESRRAAPELALRLVRERGDFVEPYATTVGIRLKIPFSAPAQVRRETAAAQAEADQADAEMRRTQSRVRLDAERARRALAKAEQVLALAQERLDLSAENLRLSEKAFALGESDLATLLRIRAAAFDAEAFLGRSHVARAAAISRLNQALGVLP